MPLQLTPLESAILQRLLQRDTELNMLPPNVISVLSRNYTPCGRYVTIACERLKPGWLQLNMEGLPSGITADLTVVGSTTGVLELVVNGGESWDGEERTFYFA